jgi:hypothetical protein
MEDRRGPIIIVTRLWSGNPKNRGSTPCEERDIDELRQVLVRA